MPDAPHSAAEAGSGATTAMSSAPQSPLGTDAASACGPGPAHPLFGHSSDEEDEVVGSGSVGVGANPGDAGASGSVNNGCVIANGFGAQGMRLASPLLPAADSSLCEAATLIPPSLQSSTISSALASNADASVIDDNQPLSSPDDYAAVAREARLHWTARRKQPASVVEQSAADIGDLISGPIRRRVRLVLTQLHDLLDKTPRIYELLELKRTVQSSTNAQIRLDRSLNSLWNELKAKCSLLIVNKDTAQSALSQVPTALAADAVADPVAYVQALVSPVMEEILEHCALLWDQFDVSVRGLVFIDCGKQTLEAAFRRAPSTSTDMRCAALSTLLSAYSALPDLYKVDIKGIIETIAASNDHSAGLVISGLRRHHVLPGVMFRMVATLLQANTDATLMVRFLDDIFNADAPSWIGKRASGSRPKYATAGDDIRRALYQRFSRMGAGERQQHAPTYARVVSGLTSYLRLDAQRADFEFATRAVAAAIDSQASMLCVALLLVMVGFSTEAMAQDTLELLSSAAGTPAANQLDCILALLKTDRIREIGSFVANTLGMEVNFPHERLFCLKDIIAQSGAPFFASANLARRLLTQKLSAVQHGSRHMALYVDAVLYSLQASLFQNAGVDIRPWICQLVQSADTAAANNLGGLIQAYVSALFGSAAITPIPEAFIWRAFAPEQIRDPSGQRAPPTQVLCLLYILHYCSKLAEQPKPLAMGASSFGKRPSLDAPAGNGIQPWNGSLGTSVSRTNSTSSQTPQPRSGTGRSSPIQRAFSVVQRGEYSDELLDALPVAWILQCVGRTFEYQHIWPELLAMATAQFPDQLDVVSVLQREIAGSIGDSGTASSPHGMLHWDAGNRARQLIKSIEMNPAAEDTAQWKRLLQAIEEYSGYPASVRMETCDLFAARLCRVAIAGVECKELTARIRRAWYAQHALNPHRVSAVTAGAWRSASEQTKPKLAAQDIWLDPLVVLRVDARVFGSADLTDVLLAVLAEALVQSRTALRRIFALRHRDNGALQKAHLSAILQLQESSAVQLLIEAAARVSNADVRWLMYEFIHARFLEQRTIQKLVHFQAYDVSAIADMVAHVPSMHACSEFIPELLMQSAPALQLFAVRLAAAIVTKYPISANEGMAKEVILPHVQTTLAQLAGTAVAEQLAVSNAMLQAVSAVGAAFSLIRQDCAQLVCVVRDAAIERTRATPSAPLQREHSARWVRYCDKVLAALDAGIPVAETQIEDIEAKAALPALETALKHDKATTAAPARNGSPKRTESMLPPVAGQQQPQTTFVPPQSQGQPGAAIGAQKRPHSTMAVERGPLLQPPPPPVQGQAPGKRADGPMLPGLSRVHSGLPGLRPPDQAALNGATPPSLSLPHANAALSAPGGLKKRRQHRGRNAGKDGGPKRSRNISVERARKEF